jgi:hypothetical protein
MTPEERAAIRAAAERDVDDLPPLSPELIRRLAEMVAPAINAMAREET